jgi:sarcosine oxidase
MPAVATSDVIVVGLGAMGSATCLQLATRGVSVRGIDQHHPPHPYGSTHGETRITRLAIGEGPEYVPLVRRSHELWSELEEQTGSRLMTRSGGLIMGNKGNEFVAQTRACAQQYAIAYEDLSAAELAHRFPMFAVDHETEAYYEPTAGYLRPEEAVKAQLELAAHRGAQLRLGERAERWVASPQGVTVTTTAGTYAAGQLVICVGAWIARLLPEVADTFAVHRQLMFWFAIREGYPQLRTMPIFVWDFGGQKDAFVHFHGFYGFPAIDGPAGGVKVGTESYEHTTTADEHHQPPSEHEAHDVYRSYVAPGLPWLGPELLRAAPCLYTSTRASRFVIDRHPDHDTVWIVSACSGHGFKHSPAIGEAVAQQLTVGDSELGLSPFGLAQARA